MPYAYLTMRCASACGVRWRRSEEHVGRQAATKLGHAVAACELVCSGRAPRAIGVLDRLDTPAHQRMHVCMYACMHAYVHVCIGVLDRLEAPAHQHARMHARTHVCTSHGASRAPK